MATNFLINGSEFSDNFIPKDAFTSGGLWSWGNNSFGQLGDAVSRNTPGPIIGSTWRELQYSSMVSAASGSIKTDGTLWMWGRGNAGNLGVGDTTSYSSPVQVPGTTWKQLSASLLHSAAIKTDGTLWTWGQTQIGFDYGRLGDGTTVNKSSPVQTAVAGSNWKMVSCGYYHTAALKTDGTLWVWGKSTAGQLGTGSVGDFRSTPVQVGNNTTWKQISSGDRCTMAIKTDGTLWTWGEGYNGGLGTGSTASVGSPTQVAGTTWKFVSAGRYNGAALKTDGTLWLWGSNVNGNLGDGTTTNRSSPVQTVSAGNNWKFVSNGGYFAAGIKTDGTLWTWGNNDSGSLGDGTTVSKSSPVQIYGAGTNWKQIYCSSYGGYNYMTALRDNS